LAGRIELVQRVGLAEVVLCGFGERCGGSLEAQVGGVASELVARGCPSAEGLCPSANGLTDVGDALSHSHVRNPFPRISSS
jgi:hypothetical protein